MRTNRTLGLPRYCLLSIWRSVKIGIKFPRPFISFLLFFLLRPFGVKIQRIVEPVHVRQKDAAVKFFMPLGWVMGERMYRYTVFNRQFLSRKHSETEANILNFFFLRNPFGLLKIFKGIEQMGGNLVLRKRMKIFEPGCNAGKLLFFLKDLFSGDISGCDIYEPAIKVAKLASGANDHFFCADLVNSSYLDRFNENGFELTIINSHLTHVFHLQNFTRYFSELLRISQQIVVYERYTLELFNFLKQFESALLFKDFKKNLVFFMNKKNTFKL